MTELRHSLCCERFVMPLFSNFPLLQCQIVNYMRFCETSDEIMSSGFSIDTYVKFETFSNEKDRLREKMPLCLVDGYLIVHVGSYSWNIFMQQ